MRLSLNFISLFFLILFNISSSNAFIQSHDSSKKINISKNINLINNPKIGIVDFRNILKDLTIKNLEKNFSNLKKDLIKNKKEKF